jgi:ABC-type molybdate transport system substrate-binding protein
MMRAAIMAIVMSLAAAGVQAQAAHEEIVVFAAGSLRSAMTEVAKAFEASAPSISVKLVFGASGLLKDRIAAGERADVFASANMAHPKALAAAGKASPVQRFARNTLCALVSPKVRVTPETLVDQMLDPAIKLGTSTPKADPSGDYAMAMFERVDQGRPGAFKALSGKALQLTGGPNSPPPPVGKSVYGVLVAEGQADIFITYCTNALIAVAEQPGLKSVAVPDAINVGADYGVAVVGAAPAAERFVAFLLAPSGQAILTRQGFAPG